MQHDNLYKDIGWKIAEARKRSKLTQQDLANCIKLSRASVANIERGEQNVMIHTLLRIADLLNEDVSYFLPDSQQTGKSVLRMNGSDKFTEIERAQIGEIVDMLPS